MQGLIWGSTSPSAVGSWGLGSMVGTAMFLWMTLRELLPVFSGERYFRRWGKKLLGIFYPYVDISFPEFSRGRYKRSAAFVAIESYLSDTCSGAASRLTADVDKGSSKLVFSMGEDEEVIDHYEGVCFTWSCFVSVGNPSPFSFRASVEKRSYRLTFHSRHRRLVEDKYLSFVMAKGKEIKANRRQRRLFTNNSGDGFDSESSWSYVPFEHPARMETIAMDPVSKEELVEDLLSFRESKEYYARVGKAWKRGYLLHGPPGTGKSSMIAAMANLLEYDVYDLELTAVKNNSSLRQLLIGTSSRAIIVVEDIDCSLDLTGRRRSGGGAAKKETEAVGETMMGRESGESEESKVTLSGLLNIIDGLWSACAGGRIIVFTTNHVEKLDPALIRRGRMDKHIELSYCRFEAFKVLAKNYLQVADHPLFADVQRLIEEVDIIPADVAELLMPGARRGGPAMVEKCLRTLVGALEERKAKAAAEAAE